MGRKRTTLVGATIPQGHVPLMCTGVAIKQLLQEIVPLVAMATDTNIELKDVIQCVGMFAMVTYMFVKFGRSASAFWSIVSSLELLILL